MSTKTHEDNIPEHPGKNTLGTGVSHLLLIGDSEGQFARHPARIVASLEAKYVSVGFGGELGDDPTRWTATLDNSSTIAFGTGGIIFKQQATPTDADDVARTSLETKVLASGDRWKCSARAQVSSAANEGMDLGFVTSTSTEIFTANPNDGVFFIKAKNATGLTARVVSNGAAAVDLALFNPDNAGTAPAAVVFADATDVQLGIEFQCGPDVNTTFGWWWVNGFKTPMSAAQITALIDMLANTPPTLACHAAVRVNGTTQRSGTFNYAKFDIER